MNNELNHQNKQIKDEEDDELISHHNFVSERAENLQKEALSKLSDSKNNDVGESVAQGKEKFPSENLKPKSN